MSDTDDLRRELAKTGMDIGYVQSYSRAAGIATPTTEKMLDDLRERNATALRAAGEQIDPDEFKRRVQIRRRMAALRRRGGK